jgi:hypothetical protein
VAATLDQDLAVSSVRAPDAFLVTAVQLPGFVALAIECFDDFFWLTVP